MAVRTRPDFWLFGAMFALVVFGLLMTYSASAIMAEERHQSSVFFLGRQCAWAALGIGVLLRLMRIDYRKLNHRLGLHVALLATVTLLAVVLALPAIKGTHRWLRLGSLSFQPSELAKLTLALYLAHHLSGSWRGAAFSGMRRGPTPVGHGLRAAPRPGGSGLSGRLNRLQQFRTGVMSALVVPSVLVGLVLVEPDLGTAFSLGVVAFVLLFVAGAPLGHLAGVALAAVAVGGIFVTQVKYAADRLLAFLHPSRDPLGDGFQLIQSLIAVGTGGLTGLGFMQSKQKQFFLPESHTDFIYSIVNEEFGFAGGVLVLSAFAVILWRGLVISRRAPDVFGALAAIGLTSMVVIPAFINVGVVIGLLPTTGIPLPFISAGGSSMAVSLAAIGLLLAISQHAEPSAHGRREWGPGGEG